MSGLFRWRWGKDVQVFLYINQALLCYNTVKKTKSTLTCCQVSVDLLQCFIDFSLGFVGQMGSFQQLVNKPKKKKKDIYDYAFAAAR